MLGSAKSKHHRLTKLVTVPGSSTLRTDGQFAVAILRSRIASAHRAVITANGIEQEAKLSLG